MAAGGVDFQTALAEAQRLGYAEPDPTNDIEGIDAAYKLVILASLAFNCAVRPQDVYREGITRISAADFRYAAELGYGIKLLAITKRTPQGLEARVHPALIQQAGTARAGGWRLQRGVTGRRSAGTCSLHRSGRRPGADTPARSWPT